MSMADEMREHLQNHIVPFWQKLEDKATWVPTLS